MIPILSVYTCLAVKSGTASPRDLAILSQKGCCDRQHLPTTVSVFGAYTWPRGSTGVQTCGVVRRTNWERSLKIGSSKSLVLKSFLGGENVLGLVPASLPHTLGYACTFYAPTSPAPIRFLGGRFGYFLFFSARGRGRERGSPRRREGEGQFFYGKSQEGGFLGGWGRGPGEGVCGEFGGGGALNISFGAEIPTKLRSKIAIFPPKTTPLKSGQICLDLKGFHVSLSSPSLHQNSSRRVVCILFKKAQCRHQSGLKAQKLQTLILFKLPFLSSE